MKKLTYSIFLSFFILFLYGCGSSYNLTELENPKSIKSYQFSIVDEELAEIELDLATQILGMNFKNYSSKEQIAVGDVATLIDEGEILYTTVNITKRLNKSLFDEIKLEDSYNNYDLYIFKGAKGYSMLIYDAEGGLGTYYEFK